MISSAVCTCPIKLVTAVWTFPRVFSSIVKDVVIFSINPSIVSVINPNFSAFSVNAFLAVSIRLPIGEPLFSDSSVEPSGGNSLPFSPSGCGGVPVPP